MFSRSIHTLALGMLKTKHCCQILPNTLILSFSDEDHKHSFSVKDLKDSDSESAHTVFTCACVGQAVR